MNEQITGGLFKRMILHGAAAITAQKQAINDLNVFPVPDGDTGTNMSMTIGAAVTELRKSEPAALDQAVSITASALLRGARGNSGVILSLLFRGLSKGLKGYETAGAAEFAAAMQEGVSSAYKAVMKPAEGTVLTVSRLAAMRAAERAAEETDFEKVLEAAIQEGYEALAQTTDMNPVLKKAGVVDAGGKGYLLILEGMLAELRGEPMPEAAEEEPQKAKADFEVFSTEEITFAFDTVFIVRKNDPNVDLEPFRAYLNSIGDSLVIGEDDEAFKVHVHTNIPGSALTEGQKYGTLELAKIENMRTQYEDVAAGKKAQSVDDLEMEEAALESRDAGPSGHMVAPPEKKYGFLSVCAGDGLAAVFQDLGVDGVVSGGQTMNPSTESILEGVDQIPAETVFVLPNNGNIIMAAQQCAALTEKNVVVIPTKTVPQGITAMMNVDFEAPDAETLAGAMTDSLSGVTTAQITYAARDSDFDGFDIKEGDYLALKEGKLFGTDGSLHSLLEKLAADAAERDASFISLYFGEDVTEEDAQEAGKFFETACPGAEVMVLSGGQPVYYYIISME
ncbi:MAG: DAK2 domain-containing protein [Oscillibacter sp.]|uniref:DAK2 domain-containing protein n=1 Tax=Oscillibacter sp. TaxID=1945593 RepID=UPI00217310D5|nr:DAK2 domain-containing protein [Oscillibacter sp.]MCI8841889.1 DAK2 domain-containing protein [Oscillibacter sp.]MCI9114135.1 DAK2 domain-containing protein [Oscillibacter sp.]